MIQILAKSHTKNFENVTVGSSQVCIFKKVWNTVNGFGAN